MDTSENINNLAQHINYIVGSNELELFPLYMQSFTIPGISFSHPEYGGRYGSKVKFQADCITFNQVTLQLLLDETFNSYREFMQKAFSLYNPQNGTFTQKDFNIFIVPNNTKGHPLFVCNIYDCKIESIDDIDLGLSDSSPYNTFSVTITYNYYTMSFTTEDYDKTLARVKNGQNTSIVSDR